MIKNKHILSKTIKQIYYLKFITIYLLNKQIINTYKKYIKLINLIK